MATTLRHRLPCAPADLGRGVLFLTLFLLPLALAPALVNPVEPIKVAILQTAALGLIVLGVIHGGRVNGWLREPPVLGALAFLAAGVVATVGSQYRPHSLWGAPDSYAGLTTLAALTVLFLAVRGLCRGPADARRLLYVALAAAALVAVEGLCQWAVEEAPQVEISAAYEGHFRPFATLGHPIHLGGILAVCVPLAVYAGHRAWRRGRRWRLAVLGAALVVMLLALAATLSRGAWLGLAGGLVALAAAWPGLGRWRWRLLGGLGALGLLAAVAVAVVEPAAWGPLEGLASRLRHLGDLAGRNAIWQAAWAMFCDRPLCGWGLDTFALGFAAHRPASFLAEEGYVLAHKAHCEPLHVLATMGLAGAAACVAWVAGLAWAWHHYWRSPDADRPLAAALLAALVAHGLVILPGFPGPAAVALVTTLGGILAALAVNASPASGGREPPDAIQPVAAHRKKRERGDGWARSGGREPPARQGMGLGRLALTSVVTLAAGLAFTGGIVRPLQASAACRDGMDRLATNVPAALPCLERAAQLDPANDRYWLLLGQAVRQMALDGPPADRARRLEQALHAMERACAVHPGESQNHLHRARTLIDLGQLGRADGAAVQAAFAAAMACEPRHPFLLVEACFAALKFHDLPRAWEVARHGQATYPDFAPIKAVVGYLHLAEGRPADAVPLLERSLQPSPYMSGAARGRTHAALAEAQFRLGHWEAAVAAARAVVDQPPGWPGTHQILAAALRRLGRNEEAREEYRRLLARYPDLQPARDALRELEGVGFSAGGGRP